MALPHHFRVVTLTLGTLLAAHTAVAQPDFTKKEHKPCAHCHDGSWTSGKYTDAGMYFAKSHTLKGFVPKPVAAAQQAPKAADTAAQKKPSGK